MTSSHTVAKKLPNSSPAVSQGLKSELEECTTLLTETEVDLENMKSELKESESKVSVLEESSASLGSDKSILQAQVENHVNTMKSLQVNIVSLL